MLQLYPRHYVECTDDPMWGCGILLSSPGWQSPKNWTAENVMGKVLTTVASLVRWESSSEETKREYLREEVAKIDDVEEWREEMAKFIQASLSLDESPDAFAPPHWPGAAAMETVRERLHTLTPHDIPELAFASSSANEKQEDLSFVSACLFCLEGCLGLRMA